MNTNVLIDSIVRQTTVLIAQLATAAGMRAPLARIANQVFLDLVKELRDQGLGQKVIADMFGLALRTYHDKVRRLSESSTYGGRSLWEAVLAYIQGKGAVLRTDVLQRFRNDEPANVRAVLRDLVDSGLLFSAGRGVGTTYRAASVEEYQLGSPDQEHEGFVNLVWVALNRYSPISAGDLAKAMPCEEQPLRGVLDELVRDGRASLSVGSEAEPVYVCASCVVPLGSSVGWEAAVFDHFQAMVTAICAKLRTANPVSSQADWVGGYDDECATSSCAQGVCKPRTAQPVASDKVCLEGDPT